MKEKDITQKVLEDNNDIFADIVNVLLFDGKSEVEENELVNTTVHSQYKAEDGKVHIEPEAEENASNEIASPRTEPKQSTWMAKYWEGIRDGLILFLIAIPAWLAIMLLVKKRRGRKQP